MKKNILTLLLFIAFFPLFAQEDETKISISKNSYLDIGGRLAIQFSDSDINNDTDPTFKNKSSRLNFTFSNQLTEQWLAKAVVEIGFDPLNYNYEDHEKEFISNRLGYLSFKNTTYGEIEVGKFWSPYHDMVSNFTVDKNYIFTNYGSNTYNSFGGSDGINARSAQSISYQKVIKLDDSALSFGGLYQAPVSDGTSESAGAWQLAMNYKMPKGFKLGFAYSQLFLEDDPTYNESSISSLFAFGWTGLEKKLYLATTIGYFQNAVKRKKKVFTNTTGDYLEDALGVEAVIQYNLFPNKNKIYASYNLTDDLDEDPLYSNLILGYSYFVKNVIIAFEYNFSLSQYDDSILDADTYGDSYGFLVRYNF